MHITLSITIAVPDDDPTNGGDFAADLVAHVLTHYADPTFTINRTDPIAAHAATRVVDTVMAYEDERFTRSYEQRMAERAHQRFEDEEAYPANVAYVCPHCQAQPTQPCARPNGSYYKRPYVHSMRRAVANGYIEPITPWVGAVLTGQDDHLNGPETQDEYIRRVIALDEV